MGPRSIGLKSRVRETEIMCVRTLKVGQRMEMRSRAGPPHRKGFLNYSLRHFSAYQRFANCDSDHCFFQKAKDHNSKVFSRTTLISMQKVVTYTNVLE